MPLRMTYADVYDFRDLKDGGRRKRSVREETIFNTYCLEAS